jgi:hypothetical protein
MAGLDPAIHVLTLSDPYRAKVLQRFEHSRYVGVDARDKRA